LRRAEGHASSIRAQGEAEAEIIFKKGESEAKAMNVKAEAYQEYNQAAVIDRLFTSMPEVVRALASPLANVDKITIVSTGKRRCLRDEQNHFRHHQNGGAGARHVRDSFGHACRGGSASKVRQLGDQTTEAASRWQVSLKQRVGRAGLSSESREESSYEQVKVHRSGIA